MIYQDDPPTPPSPQLPAQPEETKYQIYLLIYIFHEFFVIIIWIREREIQIRNFAFLFFSISIDWLNILLSHTSRRLGLFSTLKTK